MTKRTINEGGDFAASFGSPSRVPGATDLRSKIPGGDDEAEDDNMEQGSSNIDTPGQSKRGKNSRRGTSVGGGYKDSTPPTQGNSKLSHPGQSMTMTAEDIDLDDDFAALFEGTDLSEEFMDRAKTIFESVVVSKINEKLEELAEEVEAEIDEARTDIAEDLSEKLDGYLDYVIEQWMEDNSLAVETGIKTELAESFLQGMKQLFDEHYVDIPEDESDIVEQMGARIDELEEALDSELRNNIELNERASRYEREAVIADIAEDLTDVQASKLVALAEGVAFTDADDFADKLETLRESYFPSKNARTLSEAAYDDDDGLDEDEVYLGEETTQGVDPNVAKYVKAISRVTKK